MVSKNLWGRIVPLFSYMRDNIPNLSSAMSASTRRHHGNGFITRLTYVGLVGICLIALGALVACPTEEDNEDDGDDGGPTVTFAAATSAIMEGASETIGVTLSANAGADGIAVQFGVVSDGTTAEDDDWEITTGGSSGVEAIPGSDEIWRVTIPSGSNSATITVVTSNDADLEAETLIFELREGIGYSVGETSRHTLTIDDLTPVFTFDTGETSYSFEIDEGNYTSGNPGMVGMVAADPATGYEISDGNIGARFAITDNGAITAIGGLDFEVDAIPNDYTLTVTAYNGADATDPNATAMVAIMVNDIEAGLVSSIAAYEVTVDEDGAFTADPTDQRQSLAGNAAGIPLNLGAIATVDNFIPTTFTITPSSPFTLTPDPAGAMLTVDASGLDYETVPDRGDGTRGYTLTVSADRATNDNTITLNVTVTDVDYGVTGAFTVQEDTTDPQTVTLAPAVSPIYEIDAITTITITDRSKAGAMVATDGATFVFGGTGNAMVVASDLAWEIVDEYTLEIRATISGGTESFSGEVEDIAVTVTVTVAPGFLDSPPTLFLREDGLFVAVGDTTITPAATIDLAETNEYTFVKGGFVPSNVTRGTLDPEPDSGTATFTLSGTMLMIDDDTADDFEAITGTQRYSLPITADGTANSEPITGAMTTLRVEIANLEEGIAGDPYTIDSVTELQSIDSGFRNDVVTTPLSEEDSLAAHYRLTADLDMTGDSDAIANFDPIGDCGPNNICSIVPSSADDNYFTGSFDGGGFRINNLTIENNSLNGGALFASVNNATIRDLALINVDITAQSNVAGLIGNGVSSTIERVAVSGSVDTVSVNGSFIAGTGVALTITNSLAIGNIEGSGAIGLLTGEQRRPMTWANNYAIGMVNAGAATSGVGFATGSIFSEPSAKNVVVNNYASGQIEGGQNIGDSAPFGGGALGSTIPRNNFYNSGYSHTISDGTVVAPKRGLGPVVPDPAGLTAKTDAELMALTGAAAGATNGSGWREPFDLDNDDGDNDPATGTTEIESVRCDSDGDVDTNDDYIWDFGRPSEYPVLNCMPLSPAEQRALIAQLDLMPETLGAVLLKTDGAEGGADGQFTLLLAGVPSQAATVTYTLSGTAGTDYAAFGTEAANSRLEVNGVTEAQTPSDSGSFTVASPHVNIESTFILVPVEDVDSDDETITLTITSITFADGGSTTDIAGSAIGGTDVSGGALSLIIDDDE